MGILKAKKSKRTDEHMTAALKEVVKEPIKRLSVDIPVSFYKELKTLALREDRPLVELVRDALRKYVNT